MKSLLETLQEALVSEKKDEITDEKSFREYARSLFEEAFGDDLDEDEMKEIVDGLIGKQKEDDLDWGEVVGMLQQSMGPK